MKELKPCPFCGSTDIWIMNDPYFWCWCIGCGVETLTYYTKEELIKAWNTRVEENNGKNSGDRQKRL